MKSDQSEQSGRGWSSNVVLFKSTHFQVFYWVLNVSETRVEAFHLPYSSSVEWTRDSSSSSSPASLCRRYFRWGLYTSWKTVKNPREESECVEEAGEAGTHQHVQKSPRTFVPPLEELFILKHQRHHVT